MLFSGRIRGRPDASRICQVLRFGLPSKLVLPSNIPQSRRTLPYAWIPAAAAIDTRFLGKAPTNGPSSADAPQYSTGHTRNQPPHNLQNVILAKTEKCEMPFRRPWVMLEDVFFKLSRLAGCPGLLMAFRRKRKVRLRRWVCWSSRLVRQVVGFTGNCLRTSA